MPAWAAPRRKCGSICISTASISVAIPPWTTTCRSMAFQQDNCRPPKRRQRRATMAHRLVSVETVPLTRELATQFANSQQFVGERPLQPTRLADMTHWLTARLWTRAHWATCHVKTSGTLYRVNGHHSSTVLSQAADDLFPVGSPVIIERWECDA